MTIPETPPNSGGPPSNSGNPANWKDDVFAKEIAIIDARDAELASRGIIASRAPGQYLTGICLSGGGIRSATVSLGVLQALANNKLLRHIDYLSTVSGGGYIGAALALRYAEQRRNGDPNRDPDASFPFAENSPALEFLRRNASYLAPGGISSIATGLFIVARSLLINLFIWVVLGALIIAGLMRLFREDEHHCRVLSYIDSTFNRICGTNAFFDWLLLGAAALGVALLALMVGFSLSSWRMKSEESREPVSRYVIALGRDLWPLVPIIPAVVLLHLLVPDILSNGWDPAAFRETINTPGNRLEITVAILILLATATPLFGVPPPDWMPKAATVATMAALFWLTLHLGSGDPRAWHGNSAAMVAAALCLRFMWLFYRQLFHRPAAVAPRKDDEVPDRKYRRRRFQESWSGRILLAMSLLVALGILPVMPAVISVLTFGKIAVPTNPGAFALVIYLVALASAIYGFYRTNLQGVLGLGSAFIVSAGSAFFCYGALVVAQSIAGTAITDHWPGHWGAPTKQLAAAACWWAAGIVAAALAFFVNINDVSLGRFYRDRLMEAFMPDDRSVRSQRIGSAARADRFLLSQIVSPKAPDSDPLAGPMKETRQLAAVQTAPDPDAQPEASSLLGPYPIINTNAVTRWAEDAAARRRGGDSFILAPLSCGSEATGWRPTTDVLDNEITLANAMAVSGAAANPRGGFAGTGPTTTYIVSLAMSILSIRLGYWLRWHRCPGWFNELRRFINPYGNHFFPVATDLLDQLRDPRTSRPTFVELSDGGHFENLGLYELVRRRCGLIIVCDGGEDPSASYAAFSAAATLMREDFGVEFKLDMEVKGKGGFESSGPQRVVARGTDAEYPKAAEFAQKGYFFASIRYDAPGRPKGGREGSMAEGGPSVGLLIYLKAAMLPALSPRARSYKGANPEFPYEATADQFFSTEQFEAYRDVGLTIAEQMLGDTKLADLFREKCRPSLDGLQKTAGFQCVADWQRWSGMAPPGVE